MEQYIFTNDVRQLLDEEGIVVEFKKVGDFMTAIDMAGLSLTLVKLEDSKWLENLIYKTNTIAW